MKRREIEAYRLRRAAESARVRGGITPTVRPLVRVVPVRIEHVEPIAKDEPVRSEEYRRLVASLPCKHCGIVGYSQAAHPNTGKGTGTKTDDRLAFPLCTVHPVAGGFVTGCHERFDQGALYPKAVRRELEPAWGADTRRAIEAAGLWPTNLPRMEMRK